VLDALRSMKSKLGQYTKTPPNGLVLFVGYYQTSDGRTRLINYALEPYIPLQNALYYCGSGFKTEMLREQISVNSTRYGFIVIDGNISSFHVLDGTSKKMIFKYEVDLPKKHGRGGQSQNRFARLRTEKRDWYTSKVQEFACQHFIDTNTTRPNIDGLIIAGSADLKFELGEKLDQRLKVLLITYVDVQYGGESGFYEAIEKTKDSISTNEFMKEKKIISNFFEMISKGTDLYIFGLKETMYALMNGVVDNLILWNELPYLRLELVSKKESDKKEIRYLKDMESFENPENEWEVVEEVSLLDWVLEHYEDFGSKIELISSNSPEGNQFVLGFGGIGATLRYPIQMPEDYVVNDKDDNNSEESIEYEW
jgi:peptide chain release factor subunit 1